jgi:hypothetical protein
MKALLPIFILLVCSYSKASTVISCEVVETHALNNGYNYDDGFIKVSGAPPYTKSCDYLKIAGKTFDIVSITMTASAGICALTPGGQPVSVILSLSSIGLSFMKFTISEFEEVCSKAKNEAELKELTEKAARQAIEDYLAEKGAIKKP